MKYFDYIDGGDLEILLNLGILLPADISSDLSLRSGNKEIGIKKSQIHFQQYLDFIEANGRLPDFNSESSAERIVATRYLKLLPILTKEQQSLLNENLSRHDISLSVCEKALFGEPLLAEDISELVEMSKSEIEGGMPLKRHLYEALYVVNLRYTIKQNEQIFELLDKSDVLAKELIEKNAIEQQNLIANVMSHLDKKSGDLKTEMDIYQEIEDNFRALSAMDISYVKKQYGTLRKKFYERILPEHEQTEMSKFCRAFKDKSIAEITTLGEGISISLKKYEFLLECIKNMNTNAGQIPENVEDYECWKFVMQDEECRRIIDIHRFEIQNTFNTNLGNIMQELVKERTQTLRKKYAITSVINFTRLNKRKPLINSLDKKEKILASVYEETTKSIDNDSVLALSKQLNRGDILRNTAIQRKRNEQSRKDEIPI